MEYMTLSFVFFLKSRFRKLNLKFGDIMNSRAIIKSNRTIPCTHYPVPFNRNTLQNYSTKSQPRYSY